MSFTESQTQDLKAKLKPRHVRKRIVDGRSFHYIEGWHALSEANRIFGFENWDRETTSNQCVWQKQMDRRFYVVYLAKVRIIVRTGSCTIVREGQGSAEAVAPTAGQAHDRAAKSAETDATKRALATFGNPFGLSLYSGVVPRKRQRPSSPSEGGTRTEGEIQNQVSADGSNGAGPEITASDKTLAMQNRSGDQTKIDKSALHIPEPRRKRSPDHLAFVRQQPCLICGRIPSQAHHLRFSQPRALGMKVSDEYTVPLCAVHHDELHRAGNERQWWHNHGIKPIPVTETLWRESQGNPEYSVQATDSPTRSDS